MDAPLRLLNLIRSLDPAQGGPAEGLRHSVAAARALGHGQEVLSLDDPAAAWLGGFPAPVHALGPARGTYGHAAALLPWLRAHAADYDAVVVHGLWQYPGLAARRALAGRDVPYFVWTHGMLDPWFRHAYPLKHLKKWLYWRAVESRVLSEAAAVLFTTAEEARLAAQSFTPFRARSEVLGFGLALDAVARQARAEDFLALHPALRGKRLLLYLGRLHPKKGCDLLIRAFAAVAGAHPDLQLVMAGPDGVGLQASLQALAQDLGVAGRITWTGMLQGACKWGALRAADAFVLTSHQENFGVAVGEALAVGTPVLLSTRVNTWPEVVAASAGMARPDTVDGATELLRCWLGLPGPTRRHMRAAAVPCFERHFHVDGATRRLLDLVRRHHRAATVQPSFADTLPGFAATLPPGDTDSQPCHMARPQSAAWGCPP